MPRAQASPSWTHLNRTQERILRLLNVVRYATAIDITYWLFAIGSLTWCRKICTTLSGGDDWQTEYPLVRFPLPTVRGNSTRIFALARAGAEYLHANGVQADWWYRPYRMSNQGFSYLTHHLACTRLYIAVHLFCRQHPAYQVEQVFMAHDLAKDPPRTTLIINEQETTVTLLPDLWVHLSRSDGEYFGLWIEVDTGSEHRGKWEDLLSARIAFLKQGYAAYFHTPACLLCYVVIGSPSYRARRLRQLRKWTREVLVAQQREAWQSVFRFAAVDIDAVYTYPQTLFAAPVFYLPDASQRAIPLLDTTTPTNEPTCTAEKEHTDGEHTHSH